MEVLLPCDLITYLNAYLNYAKQGLFGVLYSCSPLLQVYPYHLFVMYSFFFCGMTHHQAQYIMCVRRNFWYIIDSLLRFPQYPPPQKIRQRKEKQNPDRKKFFDMVVMLFWSCLFQLATIGGLFWADLIPHFGFSSNMTEFSKYTPPLSLPRLTLMGGWTTLTNPSSNVLFLATLIIHLNVTLEFLMVAQTAGGMD